MKFKIRVEPDFERQIEHLREWWRHNRTAARSLKALIRDAFGRIQTAPNALPIYGEFNGKSIHRVLVKTTPYHIYYYVDAEAGEAVLIVVWSGMREEPPPLG